MGEGGPGPVTRPTVSRAVLRNLEPGSTLSCAHCRAGLRFRARQQLRQVICNVYAEGRWVGTLHYHEACYAAAGEPHGPVDSSQPRHRRHRMTA